MLLAAGGFQGVEHSSEALGEASNLVGADAFEGERGASRSGDVLSGSGQALERPGEAKGNQPSEQGTDQSDEEAQDAELESEAAQHQRALVERLRHLDRTAATQPNGDHPKVHPTHRDGLEGRVEHPAGDRSVNGVNGEDGSSVERQDQAGDV